MIFKNATMSSSSQGFEFLDLSGVCDEDRQHLLSLFNSDNPAVVLLSSDVALGDGERYDDGEEAFHQVPVPPSQPQVDVSPEENSPQAEPLPVEDTIQEEYSSPVYLSEGEYGMEGKVSVMSSSTSAPPPPQVPSITSSTATTSSGPMGSSIVGSTDLAMREFSVPPPTVQGQGQVGLQQGGHQQVGPQVYHQPYPAPSPGNPPMYNPNMPPPSHIQPPPPPSNVYSQIPPPPPVIPPPGATTVYVANCHVNVSPYSGAQVPVLASNAGPSQSPPPTPVMQSVPIMPEQNTVHMQPLKAMHEGKPEFENRRFENFRGNHRGRGRARGRGRRTNNERSNSVGSDHSGYGGEKHYPETMGPPQYPGPVPAQNVYYNVHYQMRGGGYPYPNVPAAQVQGLPLMYSQPQYSQYMQYPTHSAGHLLPYQQQSGPPGSQHPAAIHVHHQPPHQQPTHHPQPHPHHYQHQPEPPHMQHHPHEHQYQVDQPEPQVEQPIFPENPEVMNNVEAEANSSFVSASQTVPTQYESNSSVGVPAPVLNASPSVTAAPEADRLTPLTTQASAMSLEDSSEVAFSTKDSTVTGSQQPSVTDDPQMIDPVSGIGNAGTPSPTSSVPALSQQNPINDICTSPPVSQSVVSKSLGSLPVVNQQSQMVIPQVTKAKIEPKSIVSLNLEHTGVSDITFMSDEIQPNVDPQEAVDFASIQKPTIVAPSTPPNGAYRVVPSLVSEGVVAGADGVSTPPSSSINIGNTVLVVDSGAAVPPAQMIGGAPLTEVPKKNHGLPEMAANPQPGGAWAQKKSWSQLFKPCEEGSGAKQVAYVAPFNQDTEKPCGDSSSRDVPMLKSEPLLSEADIDKAKIGAMLRGYIQDHHQAPLQPRGLINKGYWCYVNAPLQALLACPPFYNLMKNVPNIAGLKKGKSTTPVIDSIVEYVHEFSDMAPALKPSKKDKTNSGARMEPEIVTGSPFEPLYVYKMLANMGGDMFTEGRQQDAEEMLSVVLNGLHDEMVESLKLAGGDSTPTPDNSINGSVNGETVTSDHEELTDDDEDEWQVMGPRKKSCVTRTAHITPSPISAIFWGQLRSVLHQAGGVTTANLQPFTTLPLDIQSPKVESVRDALEHLVSREDIPDYTCSKTNQEVTVCKQVLLETLPTVLILQLKRFIYDKDGGLQKITKKVNFPIDLEITKELMSPNSRGKFTTLQRKYKLLAVIYHDGKEATKGHYIADIYHSGYNCWLRYDDSIVKAVSESNVLRHVTPRVPYLLFYRRGDTLVGSSVKPKA